MKKNVTYIFSSYCFILGLIFLINRTIQAQPIQLVYPNADGSQLLLNEEACNLLLLENEEFFVLSASGRAQSGKSWLLNALTLDETENSTNYNHHSHRSNFFRVASTVHAETKGMWIRGPLRLNSLNSNGNSNVNVNPNDNTEIEANLHSVTNNNAKRWLLLDTEGFGGRFDDRYDSKIFALTVMLSQFNLYVSGKTIDRNDLDALELLSTNANIFAFRTALMLEEHEFHAPSNLKNADLELLESESKSELKSESEPKAKAKSTPFRAFTWVAQDFSYDFESQIEGSSSSFTNWLNQLLDQEHHRLDTHSYLNSKTKLEIGLPTVPNHNDKTKQKIKKYSLQELFEVVDAHTMFLPHTEKKELAELDATKGFSFLNKHYQKDLLSLRSHIQSTKLMDTKKISAASIVAAPSSYLSGFHFVAKLRFLVNALNAVDNNANLWQHYVSMQESIVLSDSFNAYNYAMESLTLKQHQLATNLAAKRIPKDQLVKFEQWQWEEQEQGHEQGQEQGHKQGQGHRQRQGHRQGHRQGQGQEEKQKIKLETAIVPTTMTNNLLTVSQIRELSKTIETNILKKLYLTLLQFSNDPEGVRSKIERLILEKQEFWSFQQSFTLRQFFSNLTHASLEKAKVEIKHYQEHKPVLNVAQTQIFYHHLQEILFFYLNAGQPQEFQQFDVALKEMQFFIHQFNILQDNGIIKQNELIYQHIYNTTEHLSHQLKIILAKPTIPVNQIKFESNLGQYERQLFLELETDTKHYNTEIQNSASLSHLIDQFRSEYVHFKKEWQIRNTKGVNEIIIVKRKLLELFVVPSVFPLPIDDASFSEVFNSMFEQLGNALFWQALEKEGNFQTEIEAQKHYDEVKRFKYTEIQKKNIEAIQAVFYGPLVKAQSRAIQMLRNYWFPHLFYKDVLHYTSPFIIEEMQHSTFPMKINLTFLDGMIYNTLESGMPTEMYNFRFRFWLLFFVLPLVFAPIPLLLYVIKHKKNKFEIQAATAINNANAEPLVSPNLNFTLDDYQPGNGNHTSNGNSNTPDNTTTINHVQYLSTVYNTHEPPHSNITQNNSHGLCCKTLQHLNGNKNDKDPKQTQKTREWLLKTTHSKNHLQKRALAGIVYFCVYGFVWIVYGMCDKLVHAKSWVEYSSWDLQILWLMYNVAIQSIAWDLYGTFALSSDIGKWIFGLRVGTFWNETKPSHVLMCKRIVLRCFLCPIDIFYICQGQFSTLTDKLLDVFIVDSIKNKIK
jgi:hypothetical protein